MLLAIDVGNTNILYGLFDGQQWTRTWRQHTNPTLTEDELAAFLSAVMGERERPERVAVASVVPTLDERIRHFAKHVLMCDPYFISHLNTMVPVLVDTPEAVGADRIANAAAAAHYYGKPAIVVDFGTATTFDAISPHGEFVGGAIMPGVEISMNALFARASQLQEVSLGVPFSAIGKTTEENLRSGIVLGTAAAVDGLVAQIAVELGGSPAVIATGGLAEFVVGACNTVHHVDPMLTLNGIRLLADAHRP